MSLCGEWQNADPLTGVDSLLAMTAKRWRMEELLNRQLWHLRLKGGEPPLQLPLQHRAGAALQQSRAGGGRD